jgi:hypothetical protein
MLEKRSQSTKVILTRLYDSNRENKDHGHVFKLRKELGFGTCSQNKLSGVSLAKLMQTRVKASPNSGPRDQRSPIQDFIKHKRRILLSKIRLLDKKEYIKELQEYMVYEEKQLHMRIDDLKENTNLIKKNFEEQKKQLEGLVLEVNFNEEVKNDKTRILIETKNRIYQKESEIKAINEKIGEYSSFKFFLDSIFRHFNKQFDEKLFLRYFNGTQSSVNSALPSIKQIYNQENAPFVGDSPKVRGSFFLTSKNETSNGLCVPSVGLESQIQSNFLDMLNTIENDNFQLHEELQKQEAKCLEMSENALK